MQRMMNSRGPLFQLPVATDIDDVLKMSDVQDDDWDAFSPVARAANEAMIGVFVEDLNTDDELSAA